MMFICATHSPFIIQSLEEGELITLDQPLESEYSGESIEDISEDIMGVVCKLRSNGMPVPLLRNGYSIFNGTKYR